MKTMVNLTNEQEYDYGHSSIPPSTSDKTNLMEQIITLHEDLTKEGRHPLGSKGVYHILGVVKFAALKWMNKVRKD